MNKKLVLAVLLSLPVPVLAGSTNTNGTVIPSDIRAGLGDTNKVAQPLPPDAGFVGVIVSHLPANYGTITEVIPNGPGDKAKLKVGDKFVTIAGVPVINGGGDNISGPLGGKVGDVVDVTILRGKEMMNLKLGHAKISFKTVKTPDGKEKHIPYFE